MNYLTDFFHIKYIWRLHRIIIIIIIIIIIMRDTFSYVIVSGSIKTSDGLNTYIVGS
jgi:hypothetical protein